MGPWTGWHGAAAEEVTVMGEVRDDAVQISGELVELRQAIHADPEIGLDLPRTQEKVLAAIDGLPLEVTTGRALSSVTAVLRGTRPGETVLLRGDMDALPVTEATGLPYASRNDGVMHACGHDLHTAMLVGAARLLAARRGELAGNVIFMFQPGEESYAGAERMISSGSPSRAASTFSWVLGRSSPSSGSRWIARRSSTSSP